VVCIGLDNIHSNACHGDGMTTNTTYHKLWSPSLLILANNIY